LLCAEALRAHLEANSPESGWLSGIKDPVIGRAISMIHARLGEDWSVKRLAQGVAMSPSRFTARFSAALGDSPMAYVTKWRMNAAGRLLTESRLGIGEIAADVGYENVAAFTDIWGFRQRLGVHGSANGYFLSGKGLNNERVIGCEWERSLKDELRTRPA
jgi:transcriptional regulator GlxA family with amidase domain